MGRLGSRVCLADGGDGRGNVLHHVKREGNCPGGNVRGGCPVGNVWGNMSEGEYPAEMSYTPLAGLCIHCYGNVGHKILLM